MIIVILTGVIFIGVATFVIGLSRKRERVSDVGMIVMLTGIAIELWVTRNPYYLLNWFTTGCAALVILLYLSRLFKASQ